MCIASLQSASAIAKTFDRHYTVVKNIKAAIEQSFRKFVPQNSSALEELGVSECCKMEDDGLEYIPEVGQKVIMPPMYNVVIFWRKWSMFATHNLIDIRVMG